MGIPLDGGNKEMKNDETDILIVGGGPAGATSALYLTELGLDITLVEKKKFPRETLCGEFLSKEVTVVLKELDLFEEFISLKPNKLKSFKAISKSGVELTSTLNFEAYGMKRSVFDEMLLDRVKRKNINVIQPGEVLGINKTNRGFFTEILPAKGESYGINSRYVIGAYGRQNKLDKRLGRNFIDKKSQLNGVKFHFPVNMLNEYCLDEIRIYFEEGFYCGINQVNEAEVTICFLEYRNNSQLSPRDKLLEVIKSNPKFNQLFRDDAIDFIKSINVYGTGNIFFGKRKLVENGIIMIGDSARVIAPLAGDGIGMAMESAKLLSSIMNANKTEDLDSDKVYDEYEKRFARLFNRRLRTAGYLQKIMLSKFFSKSALRIVSSLNIPVSSLIKNTRNREVL